MSSLATEVIDLFASGERQKIECVLFSAGGGAISGGLAAGLLFAPANAVPVAGTAFNGTAAAVGAVIGAMGATRLALQACGAQSTGGSFERLFSLGKAPADLVRGFESAAVERYGLSADQARILTKAAVIAHAYRTDLPDPATCSAIAERQAVVALVNKIEKALKG